MRVITIKSIRANTHAVWSHTGVSHLGTLKSKDKVFIGLNCFFNSDYLDPFRRYQSGTNLITSYILEKLNLK